MTGFLRLFCVVISLAFALGTTAHGFAATNMDVMMLSSDAAVDGSDDGCFGCNGDDEAQIVCDLVCSPPMSALGGDSVGISAKSRPHIREYFTGRSDTGINPGFDPSPPRILS